MRAALACAMALAAFAATAQPAAAITLGAARGTALKATKSERTRGTILFGLRSTIARGRRRSASPGAGRRRRGTSTRTMPWSCGSATSGRTSSTSIAAPTRSTSTAAASSSSAARTGRVTPQPHAALRAGDRRQAAAVPAQPRRLRERALPRLVLGLRRRRVGARRGRRPARLVRRLARPPRCAAPARRPPPRRALIAEHSCTVSLGGTPARRATVDLAARSPVLAAAVLRPGGGRVAGRRSCATEAIARRGCRDILITTSGDGRPSLVGAGDPHAADDVGHEDARVPGDAGDPGGDRGREPVRDVQAHARRTRLGRVRRAAAARSPTSSSSRRRRASRRPPIAT